MDSSATSRSAALSQPMEAASRLLMIVLLWAMVCYLILTVLVTRLLPSASLDP